MRDLNIHAQSHILLLKGDYTHTYMQYMHVEFVSRARACRSTFSNLFKEKDT